MKIKNDKVRFIIIFLMSIYLGYVSIYTLLNTKDYGFILLLALSIFGLFMSGKRILKLFKGRGLLTEMKYSDASDLNQESKKNLSFKIPFGAQGSWFKEPDLPRTVILFVASIAAIASFSYSFYMNREVLTLIYSLIFFPLLWFTGKRLIIEWNSRRSK